MGAGKTSIGRRLAARLGMPFRDADAEIELAAGCTIPELFSRYGESEFRAGERRVIRRLLAGEPLVLATGGGAFIDPETRAAAREGAVSIWLRCPLPTLLRRCRPEQPAAAERGDPADVLRRLMDAALPHLCRGRLVVDWGTKARTRPPAACWTRCWPGRRRAACRSVLSSAGYDVVIGEGLLSRAGALLAPRLPQKRAVVVTDDRGAAASADAAGRAGRDRDRHQPDQSCRRARRRRTCNPGGGWSTSCWRRGSSAAPR